jgi:hypothetical protein
VPLLGQRSERLGEQRELADPDRQLPLLGGDHLAGCPDPVADVQVAEPGEGGRIEVALGHEQLDAAAGVLERGEDELAEAAEQHDPAGHRDLLPGGGGRTQVTMTVVEGGGGGRPVEPDRIGLDPIAPQPVELLEAGGGEGVVGEPGEIGVGRAGGVGHGLGTLDDPPGGVKLRRCARTPPAGPAT